MITRALRSEVASEEMGAVLRRYQGSCERGAEGGISVKPLKLKLTGYMKRLNAKRSAAQPTLQQ